MHWLTVHVSLLVHLLLGYFGLFLFRHVILSLIDLLANRALWFLPTQTLGLIPDRQSSAQKKPNLEHAKINQQGGGMKPIAKELHNQQGEGTKSIAMELH